MGDLHTLSFMDATETEVEINRAFLDSVEMLFGPETTASSDEAMNVFTDFIVEGRRLQRLDERGATEVTSGLGFSVRDLLTRVPIQGWPLPHKLACPCGFCDAICDSAAMEAHLRDSHPAVRRDRTFCSPVQLQLAGLTGIHVQATGEDVWKCPFGECTHYCTAYSGLGLHIARAHAGIQADLVRRLGCFWAAILDSVHNRGTWPTLSEILFADMPGGIPRASPLPPDVADRVWRRGGVPLDPAHLPTSRIAPASPLEPLLEHLREHASAGPSAAASDATSDAADLPSDIEPHGPGCALPVTRAHGSSDLLPPLPPPESPYCEEEDTEHEGRDARPFPVFWGRDSHFHEDILARMSSLLSLLQRAGDGDIEAELEDMLLNFSGQELPETSRSEINLSDPIVALLSQSRSFRVCRREIFCPVEGCAHPREIRTIGKLALHLRRDHGAAGEDTSDMFVYFLRQMLPHRVRRVVMAANGRGVAGNWDGVRCHHPGCNYFHSSPFAVQSHVERLHKGMAGDIRALGWFWGTIRTLLRMNPGATVEAGLGGGELYRCLAPLPQHADGERVGRCLKLFPTVQSVRMHFGKSHAPRTRRGWKAEMEVLTQTWTMEGPGPADEGAAETDDRTEAGAEAEAAQGSADEPVHREEPAPPRRGVRGEERHPDIGLRSDPARVAQRVDEERVGRGVAQSREEMIRRKAELQAWAEKGVNIPQLSAEQMRGVKEGLGDLFRNEVNPLLAKFQPEQDDWEGWRAFEGAYEESLDRIRKHILRAIKRDPRRLYGERRVNPDLQAAREQQTESAVQIQAVRRELTRFKDVVHEIADAARGQGDGPEALRREAKLTKEIGQLLALLSPAVMEKCFGSLDHRVIWEQLNTSEEHRGRVIEWLDAMISTQVTAELDGLRERTQALKVQEAYRVSKSVAMKRYIDTVQSPPCQIDREALTEHFARSWARGTDQFQEAREGAEFHLEAKIGDTEHEELEASMLDEKRIRDVIKSRQDLSASGVDGIGYRIIKAAGKEGVSFMRLLIGACIRNGRIPDSWKQARTILLHKKGSREEIGNWRPISITNCVYRIFTCVMARSWQALNSKVHIYSDSQKGFIQKANGCSEHAILLNEILHQASRRHEDLIVTAIDFANAFGSVPHDLIMSVMKQRGFPEWTRGIVESMYDGATSVLEVGGGRSRKIA
jgi:hypothetical protein